MVIESLVSCASDRPDAHDTLCDACLKARTRARKSGTRSCAPDRSATRDAWSPFHVVLVCNLSAMESPPGVVRC
eukprot:7799365-Lingulodinium_polyedra.AAC.1